MAKKILVVDDEPTVRSMLETFLTSLKYEVLTAASGEECLALAGSEKPQVILLDAIMPGIDGLETCRKLKAQASTRDIPVIMMTGYGIMPGQAEMAEAEDLIFKPFDLEDLLRRVSAVSKVRHLTDRFERLLAYMEELDKNRSEQGEQASDLACLPTTALQPTRA